MVVCNNTFIGEPSWYFQIYGYDFKKILQIYGYTLEKFFRIYGYDFRNFSEFMGILMRNSPDLWAVLLRFEWHNPVSWKLKLKKIHCTSMILE